MPELGLRRRHVGDPGVPGTLRLPRHSFLEARHQLWHPVPGNLPITVVLPAPRGEGVNNPRHTYSRRHLHMAPFRRRDSTTTRSRPPNRRGSRSRGMPKGSSNSDSNNSSSDNSTTAIPITNSSTKYFKESSRAPCRRCKLERRLICRRRRETRLLNRRQRRPTMMRSITKVSSNLRWKWR